MLPTLILRSCIAVLLLSLISTGAHAQTSFSQIRLTDGAGHSILLTPPSSGWPSSGEFTWSLPIPPTLSLDGGFVEKGDATNKYLEWDNTDMYWKAVQVSGSAVTGSGTENFLPKWTSTTTALTNSNISDDGSKISASNRSLVFTGSSGTVSTTGSGIRMMWAPSKRAFRAGEVNNTEWDDASVGIWSAAFGYEVIASGAGALAVGQTTTASSGGAVAMGISTTASGDGAMAAGQSTTASGNYSFAIGETTTASGNNTVAMGKNVSTNGQSGSFIYGDGSGSSLTSTTTNEFMARASGGVRFVTGGTSNPDFIYKAGAFAVSGGLGTFPTVPFTGAGARMMWIPSLLAFRAGEVEGTHWDLPSIGEYSVALGKNIKANGFASLAIGYELTSSGDYSVALGRYVSTNSKSGSFIFGDNSSGSTTLSNTVNNQFMVRADGGYILYTAGDLSTYAQLSSGDADWTIVSDSNRKENRLNIDGDDVLRKIDNLWIGSWNYKGQAASGRRHYGPMAQEFFAAFGNDGVGTIGNDTTLTGMDLDGVTLIAMKALIERTKKLDHENELLRRQNEVLLSRLAKVETVMDGFLRQSNTAQEASLK